LFSATLFLVGKITALSEVVRQALKIIFAMYTSHGHFFGFFKKLKIKSH
jgi:hypothetical protein